MSHINWSISTRLTIWYGLTMLVFLSLFAVLCYVMFHKSLHADFDRHLTHEQRELLPFVVMDGDTPGFSSLENLKSVAYETDGVYGTYVRLVSSEGEVVYSSPNFEGHEILPIRLPAGRAEQTVSREWESRPARSLYRPLTTESGELSGWLEVTGFEWTLHEELKRLLEALVLGVLVSLALAIVGGFLLARRAMRPVSALTEAANKIQATNLSERLPDEFHTRDELTELAETFNALIARLEASFDRERRFTSNAAHELLTPLTTMRNNVEIALRRERDPAVYRERLQTVLAEVEEMSETITGLLSLSRLDRFEELPRDRINVSRLCRAAADRYRDRAIRKDIELSGRIEDGVWVMADRVHYTEVVENLIENALKYTPAAGSVHVTLCRQGDEVVLAVEDNGIGFERGKGAEIFDRFYRADTPEVQSTTGSGLGLSIVKAIAHAYSGHVTATSKGPLKGSRFEFRLPAIDGKDR